ncbi:MAG: alpha/beta fold hydrolase [Candidatus Thiodiazotropha sp. (ex Dulcina madagascariensis)]|nr:alpha/beta fold hydrolase [Candidatus Thiodiazotropha sp. (ex Dulcina madagascariensis)]
MNLHYREFGDAANPRLCLLHGLFGSSVNWMGIVKRLQGNYRLLLPDLRNHGRSPHQASMDYPLMASDVYKLMDRLRIDSVSLLGHSMGGKTAMWMALQQPERIDKLVVADIAPVTYEDRFESIFQGLCALPLHEIRSREAAERYLAGWVKEKSVRQYLLQNLLKRSDGWRWRFNLPVLQAAMAVLSGFPEVQGRSYAGDVLFIHGEGSDYVTEAYQERMRRLFPHYRQRLLHGAGHWLYAEQPGPFSQAVRVFLS